MAAPGSSVRSAHGHPPHAGGAEAQRALRGAHPRPHAPHTHTHTHARARAPGEPRGRARRARALGGARPHGGGVGGRRSAALCPRRRAQRGGGGRGARAGRRRRAGAGGRGGRRECRGRGEGRAAGRVSPGDGAAAAAAAGPVGRRAASPHRPPAHGHTQAHTCRYERGAPAPPLLRPTHPGALLALSLARANFPVAPPPLRTPLPLSAPFGRRSAAVPSSPAALAGRGRAARSGAAGRGVAGAAGAAVGTAAARCAGAAAAFARTAENWAVAGKQSVGFRYAHSPTSWTRACVRAVQLHFSPLPTPEAGRGGSRGTDATAASKRLWPPPMPAGPLPAAAPGPAEPAALPGAPGAVRRLPSPPGGSAGRRMGRAGRSAAGTGEATRRGARSLCSRGMTAVIRNTWSTPRVYSTEVGIQL
ncbi:uncharacterized protein LOC143693438 [Agelaius phoeniceus]|uniref:uncharacterized protein LOC143693438 n=1 Tax=Agelaius phoeniceus TaxID=39638 RepID=UPI004054E189